MPKPWEMSAVDAYLEGEQLRDRLTEADRQDAPRFVEQLAEGAGPSAETDDDGDERGSLPGALLAFPSLRLATWNHVPDTVCAITRSMAHRAGWQTQAIVRGAGGGVAQGFEIDTSGGVRWTFVEGDEGESVVLWTSAHDEPLDGLLEIWVDASEEALEVLAPFEPGVFHLGGELLDQVADGGCTLRLVSVHANAPEET